MNNFPVSSIDKQILITPMFRLETMPFGKRSFVNNDIVNLNKNNKINTRQLSFSSDSVA